MSGFLALGVAAYFLWKADKAYDDNNEAGAILALLLGCLALGVLGVIFL